MLRQLHFSRLDLELHSRYDPAGTESLYEADQRMAADVAPLPPLPEDRFLCSFQHIFAGASRPRCYRGVPDTMPRDVRTAASRGPGRTLLLELSSVLIVELFSLLAVPCGCRRLATGGHGALISLELPFRNCDLGVFIFTHIVCTHQSPCVYVCHGPVLTVHHTPYTNQRPRGWPCNGSVS